MFEFVDWLASLAPEGETALIVRQKPQLKNGELQYHADGAIKCTWPAMLPTARIKDDWAIYGNTGSYIIDRFENGKPSASRANVEYCLCLILDDVGTDKVTKTSPLAPTWIMETSPGSFQWGYAFNEEQPTKAGFSAAIVAIAEAGYTDKGAINPVRNFRLPGSVNLKPGKDSFKAKLVEWHPEREYTLKQIVDALGVTPAEGDTAEHLPIRLSDDGNDDVMAWLNEQGLVLEKANSSGWMGVVCPNHAEHSDGNPMGRYHPVNRSYCCLHEHCSEWNSDAFLHWVEEQGGPSRQSGLRDDLLVSVMGMVYTKIEPGDRFSKMTDAKAIIEQIEKKQLEKLKLEELFERYAYVQVDDAYFDLGMRREISRSTFDALYRHHDTKSRHANSNGGRARVSASRYFDECREDKNAKALVGLTYAPGEGEMVKMDGLIYGNRWMDARPTPIAGNIAVWMDHVRKLIPNEAERNHILDVMAFKVQNPAIKINHALLIGGIPGIGKDTLLAPFFWAVCGGNFKNHALVDTKKLESQWGYAYESEIIVINELRPDQTKDRRALENTLKPIIAAPPEYLEVNRKGLHPYMAVNRLLVVAMSNFRDAIAIPSDDRRWFVTWCEGQRMRESDARAMWDWYIGGGFAAIAAYLHARDVSAFNPGATPMMTDAKLVMIQQARSMGEELIVDLIEHRLGVFDKGFIASPFVGLLDKIQKAMPINGPKVNQHQLYHALAESGWQDLGLLHTREFPTNKRIFCAPDMLEQYSKSDLRRMAEEPPPAVVKLVK